MKKLAKINVVDYSKSFSPIGDTLGLLNGVEAAAVLANKNLARPMISASEQEVDKLKAAISDYEKDNPDMETTVYLGGSPWPWDRAKAIFKAKGIERKLGNILGVIQDPIVSANRSDSYQPIGDYISLFTPDEAILRHELGHALNRTKDKSALLYLAKRDLPETILNKAVSKITGRDSNLTPFRFMEESMASTNAIRSMGDEDYQKKRLAAAALGTALGTYGSRFVKGIGNLISPKITNKIYDTLNPDFNIPGITPHAEKFKKTVSDYLNQGRETITNAEQLKKFDDQVNRILSKIPTKYTFPGTAMLGAGLTGLAAYALSGTDFFKNLMSHKHAIREETEKIGSLKRGQMEANAAMIKEIAGQGDMERVAPGIDPEVISAIASILAMDGNGDSQEDMEALLKDNPEIIEEML